MPGENMKKVLCLNCGDYQPYTFQYRDKTVEYKGRKIVYGEKYATCNCCGEEVDVPGLWDTNLNEVIRRYEKNS